MATPLEITKVQLVTIPSTDQERSVAFYESLGFEKRVDLPWADGARWVEVYLPGDDAGLAIGRPCSPTRVRIGAVELAEPVPAMFWFRDPDGNEFLMVQ
jgi:catechol 2,3-dioxygenase-like lactoylglutathione lyase family enzyme